VPLPADKGIVAISTVLILFAHPAVESSRVNRPMIEAVTEVEGVTVHDLYEAYPDFDIDIRREQGLVALHDIIVWHHPMRWYNCPALLKEWLDVVLTRGWAYGEDATALIGKRAMSAVSTGGSAHAFTPKGSSHRVIGDYLASFEQTAHLCGMHYLEPFVLHGTHRARDAEIHDHAQAYRDRILSLRDSIGESVG